MQLQRAASMAQDSRFHSVILRLALSVCRKPFLHFPSVSSSVPSAFSHPLGTAPLSTAGFPSSSPPVILWDLWSPHFPAHSILSSLSHHLCSRLLFSTSVTVLLLSPVRPLFIYPWIIIFVYLLMVTRPELLRWMAHWLPSLFYLLSLGCTPRCLTMIDS